MKKLLDSTKHILITGGSGFLGRYVLPEVEKLTPSIAYTFLNHDPEFKDALGLRINLEDGNSFEQFRSELKDVDCVIHMAGTVDRSDDPGSIQDLETQVITNLKMLHNLLSYLPNLKKFVYVSSCSASISSHDRSFYGLGKLSTEQSLAHYSTLHSIPYVILRFPQLYGFGEPHGTFVSAFIDHLLEGGRIRLVNNGSVVRSLLHVQDAALSVAKAVTTTKSGTFSIADPKKYTVREVLDTMVSIVKPKHLEIEDVKDPTAKNLSFFFENSNSALGYKLKFNLQDGMTETIERFKEGRYVSK